MTDAEFDIAYKQGYDSDFDAECPFTTYIFASAWRVGRRDAQIDEMSNDDWPIDDGA
jgi:ribosome modulation factor